MPSIHYLMKKKMREKERGRELEEGRGGKEKEERRKRKKESYYMSLSPVLFPLYCVAFEVKGAGTMTTT